MNKNPRRSELYGLAQLVGQQYLDKLEDQEFEVQAPPASEEEATELPGIRFSTSPRPRQGGRGEKGVVSIQFLR